MANKPFETQDGIRILTGDDIVDENGNSVLGGSGLDGVSTSTPVNPDPGNDEFILTLNAESEEQKVQIVVHKKTPSVEGQGDDYGPAIGIGVGAAGEGSHGDNSIAIGNDDVGYDQGANSIAIGHQAGWGDDDGIGENSIAIGHKAAYNSAPANSITFNATGEELNPDESGLFVKPIREEAYDDATLYYNTTTGEVTWAATSIDRTQLIANKEAKVIVGNTEYFALLNRTNKTGDNSNGTEGTAVAYDLEGNLVTLHISELHDGTSDYDRLTVSKFDSSGELLWQKQFDQDIDVDQVHDISIASDNNIIIAISADNGDGIDSIVLFKLSADGSSIIWQQDYQGAVEVTANIEVEISNSNQLGSGTYEGTPVDVVYVTGDQTPFALGDSFEVSEDSGVNWTPVASLFAASYNGLNNETLLFFTAGSLTGVTLEYPTKLYRVVTNRVDSFQEVAAMAIDSDNNIYVAGYYTENDSVPNSTQGLLIKTAANGDKTWVKTFDLGAETLVHGMDLLSNGDPVVVGRTIGNGVPDSAFVTRFDSTGDALWTKVLFDEDFNASHSGGDIVIDSQDNIFVSVNSSQEIVKEDQFTNTVTIAHVVCLSDAGTVVWARRVGPGPCASVATGIDCDTYGNVYLSAVTAAQEGTQREGLDYDNTARNVLAVAKYDSNGDVQWQRYIESNNYWIYSNKDNANPPGLFNGAMNIGRNMSVNTDGKLAIQFTVEERDPDDTWDNATYYQGVTIQIDQDGRTMTVGKNNEKFTVKESRIPGKFVTLNEIPLITDPALYTLNDSTSDFNQTTAAMTVTEGELANLLITSASYEYVFGNDGTFTIPNDGDIRLTQTQLGWFSIFGPTHNNGYDKEIRANCVDQDSGRVYAVGQDDDGGQAFVVCYRGDGQIEWSTKVVENGDGFGTRANAVKIDPESGNVVVLLECYASETITALIEIDPDTAKVIRSLSFRDLSSGGQCIGYDFVFTPNGEGDYADIIVVGSKGDEYQGRPATPQAGSGVGTLIIPRSDIPGLTPTTSWYISGTGITGRTVIDNIDRYPGLVSTTNGSGTGCTATLFFNSDGTVGGVWSFDTPGENYQIGDTLTFAGTQFPGGTSPANDITMTIVDNGAPNGGVNGTGSIAGTAPTTYWRLATTAQTPDYADVEGSWLILNPIQAEAFVVRLDGQSGDITWSRVLGALNNDSWDRYLSVATDSSGNIYAAGEMYAQNDVAGSDLNSYWCAVVSKFASNGTHQWTKALNNSLDNCYAKSVSVEGNSVVVLHENVGTNRGVVTKLDNTGTIKWQRDVYSGDDGTVAIDINGDIYAVFEAFVESQYGNCIKVIRFNSTGEIIWRKLLATQVDTSTSTGDYFKNGRNLSLDNNHLYVSGYTTAFTNNYNNGFLVKIPKSGDCDGNYGAWALMMDAYDVTKLTSTVATEFDPHANEGEFETVSSDYGTNWYDPSEDSYYHTLIDIKDRSGGAIEFADGTRQTTSAQQIPQVPIKNGADHRLCLEDMGKHIYITNSDTDINVPYNQDVPLPVGFTVVIVNNSGDTINIDTDGGGVDIVVPGVQTAQYWDLASPGMATLIKVAENIWFMTGNVTVD